MKKLLIAFAFGIIPSICFGFSEADYRDYYCGISGGETEVYLPDRDGGVYCDCLTEHYAIEVEFANKWAEAIGQSLYYADLTGKQPMILFIMRSEDDMRYYYRISRLYFDLGIRLELIFPDELE